MDRETYDKGRAVRAAVLGEEYVAAAERTADDFSRPLQDLQRMWQVDRKVVQFRLQGEAGDGGLRDRRFPDRPEQRLLHRDPEGSR